MVTGPIGPPAFEEGRTNSPSGPVGDHQYDSVSDTGYYGLVLTSELISGDALASQIGFTAGTAQYGTSGWFKFYVGASAACNRNGGVPYVCYVASMPYRNTVSWNYINSVSAVYGDRVESIGGLDYKVRLITGGRSDPTPNTNGTNCIDNPGLGSEWNELFYRIHEDAPDCSNLSIGIGGGYETTRHGGPQSAGANWASYTNAQTGTVYTLNSGSVSWCQEVDGILASQRVYRGFYGVALWNSIVSSYNKLNSGWRPVLELVS
jgi:hypothetical protein